MATGVKALAAATPVTGVPPGLAPGVSIPLAAFAKQADMHTRAKPAAAQHEQRRKNVLQVLTSAIGTKRTCRGHPVMSALGGKPTWRDNEYTP